MQDTERRANAGVSHGRGGGPLSLEGFPKPGVAGSNPAGGAMRVRRVTARGREALKSRSGQPDSTDRRSQSRLPLASVASGSEELSNGNLADAGGGVVPAERRRFVVVGRLDDRVTSYGFLGLGQRAVGHHEVVAIARADTP